MKLYLAGPMRGHEHYNFPAFDKAAAMLRANGHEVISPAELDRAIGFDETSPDPLPDGFVEEAMRRDVDALLQVEAIALLPGWECSAGSCFEWDVAKRIGLTDWEVHVEREGLPGEWCYLDRVGGGGFKHKLDLGPIGDPYVDDRGNITSPPPGYCAGGFLPPQGDEVDLAVDDGTNPKDRIGLTKPPLRLVPPAALIYMSRVMGLGADKYGPYNWREKAVRRTVYLEAALRHLLQALDGEDIDTESGMPHEAHAASCMAIVLDALAYGNLIDDRPVAGPAATLIAELTEVPA